MNLVRHPDFPSKFVPARHVEVWLPPGYGQQTDLRCPVIYMHDGQNLFDPEESFIGVDWGIDQALRRLLEQKEIPPPIVVGIWNTPNRLGEYMPELALLTTQDQQDAASLVGSAFPDMPYQPAGEAYLKFIVQELKPWIDSNYLTLPHQEHTAIMGSSMGGLISIYALCRYPQVFRAAGCLSTAWNFCGSSLLRYLENALPDPANHRIYMDLGGKETPDPESGNRLQEIQLNIDELVRQAGYQDNRNLLSLIFPNHEHSEVFWRSRVDIPIRFLLS